MEVLSGASGSDAGPENLRLGDGARLWVGCALLDSAFRLLRPFGRGRKPVVVVPELPAGYNLSRCVENFGCDACFRHNRELLFDDARHRSREEIAAAKAEEEEKRHE